MTLFLPKLQPGSHAHAAWQGRQAVQADWDPAARCNSLMHDFMHGAMSRWPKVGRKAAAQQPEVMELHSRRLGASTSEKQPSVQAQDRTSASTSGACTRATMSSLCWTL